MSNPSLRVLQMNSDTENKGPTASCSVPWERSVIAPQLWPPDSHSNHSGWAPFGLVNMPHAVHWQRWGRPLEYKWQGLHWVSISWKSNKIIEEWQAVGAQLENTSYIKYQVGPTASEDNYRPDAVAFVSQWIQIIIFSCCVRLSHAPCEILWAKCTSVGTTPLWHGAAHSRKWGFIILEHRWQQKPKSGQRCKGSPLSIARTLPSLFVCPAHQISAFLSLSQCPIVTHTSH